MTKAKQHSFYKKLLTHIKNDPYLGYPSNGLCFQIRQLANSYWSYDDFEKDFPILYSLKPTDAINYWFPYSKEGWVERFKLLNKAIELSAPKKIIT